MKRIIYLLLMTYPFTLYSSQVENDTIYYSTYTKDTTISLHSDRYNLIYSIKNNDNFIPHESSNGIALYSDNFITITFAKNNDLVVYDTTLIKSDFKNQLPEFFFDISIITSLTIDFVEKNNVFLLVTICEPETDNCIFIHLKINLIARRLIIIDNN